MGAGAPGEIGTDTWAVVVAAGDGARFGGRKQFADLAGRPVVSMAIKAARSVASGVVLVVPPGRRIRDRIRLARPTRSSQEERLERPRSGRVSQAVPKDVELVVVHDAARPLASAGLFRAVVQAVLDGADAAVPGLRVADTLKRVDGDVVVVDGSARRTGRGPDATGIPGGASSPRPHR